MTLIKIIIDETSPEDFECPEDSFVFVRNEIYPSKSMGYQYDIRNEEAFALPKFSSLKCKGAEKIRAYFKEEYGKKVANYEPQLKDGEDRLANSASQSVYVWTRTYNYNIVGDFLSVAYDYYWYTGGVHGMYGSLFDIFDLSTGEKLEYNDFFGDSAYANEKLTPIIASHLTDSYRADGLEYIMKQDYIPKFRVEEEGILFIFNPYEIASFAEGIIEVLVPYSELKGCLLYDLKAH